MLTIDLTGKNALITGGTRGIGRAISRRLAQAGANTLAVYRDDERTARESLAEREAFGLGAHENAVANVGDEARVERLIARAKERFPDGLDYLILNAGIGLRGKVTEVEPAQWRRMLDVNLGSAFLLTRGLIPALRRFPILPSMAHRKPL
jgi:3-oxoacyl-[acyl-carrier protein] reductase